MGAQRRGQFAGNLRDVRKILAVAEVVDDDGVCVVASLGALRRRWGSGGVFDDEFPRALMEAIRACELVAWYSGAEGNHRIEVVHGAGPESRATSLGTTPPLALRVEADDSLVVMPYSAYTMACAHEAGVPDPRMSTVIGTPPALYAVVVARLSDPDDVNGRFEVRLTPDVGQGSSLSQSLDDIPGWPE